LVQQQYSTCPLVLPRHIEQTWNSRNNWLSFSAQPSNCNVATCWHVELSTPSLLHLSFNIHSCNRFSFSMKVFQLKIALGYCLCNPPSFLFFLGVWVKLVALFIQAITTLSHKLSFSAQLTKCNVGPCWHALAHVGIQPSPPFIHWDTRFSCSIKFLDCRLYNTSFASALGRAFVIGTNTMALIQTC